MAARQVLLQGRVKIVVEELLVMDLEQKI